MTIRFACDNCGQRFRVAKEQAGRKAKCPKCGASLVAPTLTEAAKQTAQDLPALAESAGSEPPDVASHESDPFAVFSVYDDTELVYESEPEEAAVRPKRLDAAKLAIPRYVIFAQGVLLGAVALIAFILGVLVGGATDSPRDAAAVKPPRVTGRVTYATSQGETQPDDGSVVIAIPQTARPDEKIPVHGLVPVSLVDRPDDSTNPSVLALRTIGGQFARVEADGAFTMRLAKRAEYLILIISLHTRCPAGRTPKPDQVASLGLYFEDPLDLVAEFKFELEEMSLYGDKEIDRDFGQSRK